MGLALALSFAPLAATAQDDGSTGHESADTAPQDGQGQENGSDSSSQGSTSNGTGTSEGKGDGTGKGNGGIRYGGRSTGPAALVTLPPDAAYPVPEPLVWEGPPDAVDEVLPWQKNVVCDPVDKPALEAFGNLIGAYYGRPGYTTSRKCIAQKSEHYDGRAVDWQLNAFDPADRRIGDAAVTWLTDNDGEMAKRFGLQSIIWNSRSWRPNGEGWQGYAGQSPHTDHVHFSFTWDGAMMRTSWWTGVAVTQPDQGPCAVIAGAYAAVPQAARTQPCPEAMLTEPSSGYADVLPGGTGAGLALVQPLLEVPQTGVLDDATHEALLRWQGAAGVPQTGVLDPLTYLAAQGAVLPEIPAEALAVPVPDYLVTRYTPYQRSTLAQGDRGPAVEVLQQALEIEADGAFGPQTAAALLAATTEHPLLTPSEQTSAALWRLLEIRDYPTLAYRNVVLELGANGPDVAILQAQLGVEADGRFGPVTQQAVRDAQAEAGLEPTGVVDGPTWAATDDGVAGPQTRLANDMRGGRTEPWTTRD